MEVDSRVSSVGKSHAVEVPRATCVPAFDSLVECIGTEIDAAEAFCVR
jgi:hypothetical protein